ncbi:MAG TPA: hypothetical protein VLJ10_02755 [Candidatus Bathyarchaeia archaeon]|nr:hypothetical protein [Candidatus Bathyarchaeia archaeon]
MSTIKRNIFLHLNQFQKHILLYILSLGSISLILILLFLAYLHADYNNFFHAFEFYIIKRCILFSLPIIAGLILFVCLYSYRMTNRIFGPYNRVVKELDDLLSSCEKRQLKVRQGDAMFDDLVQRINKLIERLP